MRNIRFSLACPLHLHLWGRAESSPPQSPAHGEVLLLAQLASVSKTALGELQSGRIMLLTEATAEPISIQTDSSLVYALFAPENLEFTPDFPLQYDALPASFRPVDWPGLHPMLRRLCQEDFDIPVEMRESALHFLLHELFFQHRLSLESRKNGGLDPLLRYLHHHFHEPLSVMAVAEQFDYCPQYLSRMFRQQSGQTIHAYVTRLRMLESVRLLQERGMTIREVSRRVGYTSEKLFVRNFKRSYGMPPSQYRMNTF